MAKTELCLIVKNDEGEVQHTVEVGSIDKIELDPSSFLLVSVNNNVTANIMKQIGDSFGKLCKNKALVAQEGLFDISLVNDPKDEINDKVKELQTAVDEAGAIIKSFTKDEISAIQKLIVIKEYEEAKSKQEEEASDELAEEYKKIPTQETPEEPSVMTGGATQENLN